MPKLIIGAGDSATTVWLNKCENEHGKTSDVISQGNLPKTLMIAKDTGSWKHDYTLAQPHGLLERAPHFSSAKDFVTKDQYQKNNYVNARHLFQSNLINLSETDAPLALGISVDRIEHLEKP